ncbi:MAG: class I mannose-6-phosphate isomerase [Clostridia bacterium]|nr:class I mannose-6-phosphate isomerase [Clostridia bacterium]
MEWNKLTENLSQSDISPAGPWLYGVNPGVYRITDADALAHARDAAAAQGRDSLRILAPSSMGDALAAFRPVADTPDGLLLEMPLTADCPLLPLRMHPAYRHGEMTPWGGDQLRRVFGKNIPDDRTGEAMELSVIPGLESVTDNGQTLSDLIAREPRVTGLPAGETFPLLLKLLAAKGSLSVQVHPDDAYAATNEGKLGKTEAWVILEAEENASILYGIKEGVSLAQLEAGLLSGADIEPLIARVPARPGDVFFMPAGMVHAIGGGILLYEIQQSSDVTYRLWDFNRTNDKGEKRPLHIRQSIDVIRPELKGQTAQMPTALDDHLHSLLQVPAFRLDCAAVATRVTLPPCGTFRILTVLDPLTLSWQGGSLNLIPGCTVFLPAAGPELTLSGKGRALLSGC